MEYGTEPCHFPCIFSSVNKHQSQKANAKYLSSKAKAKYDLQFLCLSKGQAQDQALTPLILGAGYHNSSEQVGIKRQYHHAFTKCGVVKKLLPSNFDDNVRYCPGLTTGASVSNSLQAP